MALYFELPIYKDAFRLVILLYRVTRSFSREYKYTIGQDLKRDSMEMVRCVFRANSTHEKKEHLLKMYDTLEIVKLQMRVCVEMKLVSISQQSEVALLLESIGRQLMGWKKNYEK